ncbi:hypothetical protein [Mesorhizobium sp. CAU 1732]|uniref:hypothetical protein n=1 Tax=Mesorhizobium sp. CAU 1732 TaxID=3140358 RepID=UPI0032609196
MRKLHTLVFGIAISLAIPLVAPSPAPAATVDIMVGSNLNRGRAITCAQGQRLLQNRGLRNVRRIDCRGRFFIYHARRGTGHFEVALSSRTGRVVDFRRIR